MDTSVAWIFWSSMTPVLKTLMSVSCLVFGYASIPTIIAAQAFTGQISFVDACWVIAAYRCPFFWSMNVIVTNEAYFSRCNHLFVLEISLLLRKKQISRTVIFFVFRKPVTLVYSHNQSPKTSSPTISCAVA